MSIGAPQISYFIKNEAGFSLDGGNISDYLGLGLKASCNSIGSVSAMLAGKVTDSSCGGFLEGRYTTPSFGTSNIALESRTRYLLDKQKTGDLKQNITERMALKYSKNVGKFNFYEILGANVKYSVDENKFKSLSGVSLTGVGTKIANNLSAYTEVELSKTYNVQNKNWGAFSPAVYVGLNYNF